MGRPRARAVRVVIALAILAGAPAPATAGGPTDRVREFFAGVNRAITDPTYEDRPGERLGAIRRLIGDIVEFRDATSIALGSAWTARTLEEQDEFVRLFTDILQTSVFASVGSRARVDNGLAVSYIGELNDRDGVTVATSVLTRSGNELAVGYRMVSRAGRWMVYDVVIDGVSLVENYRAQFQKVIQRSSYAGLVGEMRARLVELEQATGTVSVALSAPVPVPAVTAVPLSRPIAARARDDAPSAPAPAPAVIAAVAPPEAARVDTPVAEVRPPSPSPPASLVATPPRANASRASSVSAYWVQVGAFRNEEAATRMATVLREEDITLLTTPGARPLLRVLVGPFTEHTAAASKLREIRARGYDAFIAEATD